MRPQPTFSQCESHKSYNKSKLVIKNYSKRMVWSYDKIVSNAVFIS